MLRLRGHLGKQAVQEIKPSALAVNPVTARLQSHSSYATIKGNI